MWLVFVHVVFTPPFVFLFLEGMRCFILLFYGGMFVSWFLYCEVGLFFPGVGFVLFGMMRLGRYDALCCAVIGKGMLILSGFVEWGVCFGLGCCGACWWGG